MNFGAIGSVIGHEITHALDDREFDLNGNLNDWWQTATKELYSEKTKCIIEQYGNYTEPLTEIEVFKLCNCLFSFQYVSIYVFFIFTCFLSWTASIP